MSSMQSSLQDLVTMEKSAGKESKAIAANENEEITEFRRASSCDPLSLATRGESYMLIDVSRGEDAVDLTRTMTLLQPDSTATNAAYVIALEHVMHEANWQRYRKRRGCRDSLSTTLAERRQLRTAGALGTPSRINMTARAS